MDSYSSDFTVYINCGGNRRKLMPGFHSYCNQLHKFVPTLLNFPPIPNIVDINYWYTHYAQCAPVLTTRIEKRIFQAPRFGGSPLQAVQLNPMVMQW